ncbi:MAG: hypothetical protein IJU75_05755 [Clostridia bacterium]|nr:hypothetical protein [Clostridia bacterium]
MFNSIKQRKTPIHRIKSKLYSAVAMLVLSAVMLSVSTYAWVTISANPEVSGINTSIAGNGFLQVALLGTETTGTGTYVMSHPTGGGRGQSMLISTVSNTEANNHYGNIVDLSNGYGLDGITLTPARLNLIKSGNSVQINPQYPLIVPVYGKDGRVIRLQDAPKAHYDVESDLFEDTAHWGVNVIGYKSELNDAQSQTVVRSVSRESIRAEAAQYIYHYREQIRNDLISALEAASDDIFGVINKTTLILWMPTLYGWEDEDIQCVRNISNMLSQVASESDIALRWAFLAYCVSDSTHFDSENEEQMAELGRIYKQFQTMPLIPGEGDTSDFNIRSVADANGYASLVTAIDAINQVKTRVAAANVYLDAGQPGNAGACIISVTGSYIMNGGTTPNQVFTLYSNGRINTASNKGYFANLRTGRTTDTFFFVGGNNVVSDGLFQAMARVVGDYTATLQSDFIFSNLIANTEKTYTYDLKVTSKNTSSLSQYNEQTNTGTLGQIYTAVSELQTSGTVPLEINRFGVNAYGYQIDLAFLSNENGSLILERDGIDRLTGQTGSNSQSAELFDESCQGNGSTFSFTRAIDLSDAQVSAILGCLRIVFALTDGQIQAVGVPMVQTVKGDIVTGQIRLYNVNQAATANEGILTLGSEIASNAVTTIQRNRELDVSVIVYLDGDQVKSGYTSASRGFSLDGTLNLQFRNSSALTYAGFD